MNSDKINMDFCFPFLPFFWFLFNRTIQSQLWVWQPLWHTRWATTLAWAMTWMTAAMQALTMEAASWLLPLGMRSQWHPKNPSASLQSAIIYFFLVLILSHPFPRVFNDCNLRELKSYLKSGGGKCLFNMPNTRVMYGGQRCGNGYLEDGEECDCGDEEVPDWPPSSILFSRACAPFVGTHARLLCRTSCSCRNAPALAAMPTTAPWKLEPSALTASAVKTARCARHLIPP